MAITARGTRKLEALRTEIEAAERQIFWFLNRDHGLEDTELTWRSRSGMLDAAEDVDRARIACDPSVGIPAPTGREAEQGGESIEEPPTHGSDRDPIYPVEFAADQALALAVAADQPEDRELRTRALAIATFVDSALGKMRAARSLGSVSNTAK